MGNQIYSCVGDENDSSTKLLERALAKDTQLNNDIKLARTNKRVSSKGGLILGSFNTTSPKDVAQSPPSAVKIESTTLRRSPKNKN